MKSVVGGVVAASLAVGVVLPLIPGASVAATISPKRLVEVVDFSPPIVSPDGRRVAFRTEQASVERNSYDSVWYVQEMDGATPPRRVGDGGVPLRDSTGGSFPAIAVWSPDSNFIYFRALLDGRVDVWRAAADGSRAEAITFDAADVREFSLSTDGGAIRYSVGATRDEVAKAEQDEYDEGIRIAEDVPVGAVLFRSSFVGGRHATQRYTGNWFTRGPMLWERPSRWIEVDLGSGERRELEPSELGAKVEPENLASVDLPKVLFKVQEPNSGRVAVVTRADGGDRTRRSEKSALAIHMGDGSRHVVECTTAHCVDRSITSVLWHADGDLVIFTTTSREDGESQAIFMWSLATGETWPIAASRGLINGGRDRFSPCGLSKTALVCVASEADRPPRLERIDIASGSRHLMYEPNAALDRDLRSSISSRLVRWRDDSGREFSGQLFVDRRASTHRRPLFINYYRCIGFLRGGMGDEWPLASLAESGIATLCINAPALHADPFVRYDGAVNAVRSVVDQLVSEGEVDADRIGMGGLSFGSEVALWVAVQTDILSAVSLASPSVSPLYYLMGSVKGDAFTSGLRGVWGLGAPEETPEQWRRLSPAYNVDKIDLPLLLQIPEEEYISALEYAIPLMRDHRAELYVFPDEPHRKFQPKHMLSAYERNLDWFRFWLQDVEDPDSRSADRYRHWRMMRDRLNRFSSRAGEGAMR